MRTKISAGFNGLLLLSMFKRAMVQASVTAHRARKVPLQETIRARVTVSERKLECDPTASSCAFSHQCINC